MHLSPAYMFMRTPLKFKNFIQQSNKCLECTVDSRSKCCEAWVYGGVVMMFDGELSETFQHKYRAEEVWEQITLASREEMRVVEEAWLDVLGKWCLNQNSQFYTQVNWAGHRC